MKVLDAENIQLVSVNNKYTKNRSGRLILTNEYRQFKKTITTLCKKVKIDKPYEVKIWFSGRHDIDNCIKPILDGLQAAGVISNDKHVYKLNVTKTTGKKTRLVVEVNTINMDNNSNKF